MRKKYPGCLMAAYLALSLVACGSASSESTPNIAQSEEPVEETVIEQEEIEADETSEEEEMIEVEHEESQDTVEEEQEEENTMPLLSYETEGIYRLNAYYPETQGIHLIYPERGVSVPTKYFSLINEVEYEGETEADCLPTKDGGVLQTVWVVNDGDQNTENDRVVEAAEVFGKSENGYSASSYRKKYIKYDENGEIADQGYVGKFTPGVSDIMTLDAPMQKVIANAGALSVSFYATAVEALQDGEDVVLMDGGEILYRAEGKSAEDMIFGYDADHGIFSVCDRNENRTAIYFVTAP